MWCMDSKDFSTPDFPYLNLVLSIMELQIVGILWNQIPVNGGGASVGDLTSVILSRVGFRSKRGEGCDGSAAVTVL